MSESGDSGMEVGEDLGVERLLRLLWEFRTPGRVCTNADIEDIGYPDLTDEASGGRRNFFNDRKRLLTMGIVLDEVKGTWRVTGNPADVLLELTPGERDALVTARLLLADDDAAASSSRGAGIVPAAVPTVMSALSDGHPVHFVYAERDRFVDPVSVVVNAADHWFLQGIDRDLVDAGAGAEAARTFRMDRATRVRIDRSHTIRPVSPLPDFSLHPTGWRTDPEVHATVRFPHEPLPEWLAILGGPASDVALAEDGTVTAGFTVVNHTAFVRRVLAIGAEILEPPELRAKALATLQAHLASFGSSFGSE